MVPGINQRTPEGANSHHRKCWDGCIVSAAAESLLSNAPGANSRARTTARESGAWLNALPLTGLEWTTT